MESVLRGIYWSVAAIIFIMALYSWIKMDEIMQDRYESMLYNNKSVEINNSEKNVCIHSR